MTALSSGAAAGGSARSASGGSAHTAAGDSAHSAAGDSAHSAAGGGATSGASHTHALAELLRAARSAVVLTGAGVSVPSGIPDFRTPGTGLWANVDPMEVAHVDAWRRDPDRFWRFYGDRFASLVDKRPNDAHRAIVELERRGLVRAVVTQNVDRLHRLAGTERLVEVHGSIESSVCMRCGGRVRIEHVVEALKAADGAPECAACVEPLKPAVVLFGELLPADALEEAQRLAREADLMVCIGSSLEVHPVSALPALTRSGGGKIALITQGRTPYDGDAAVKLEGDVVTELDALLAALG